MKYPDASLIVFYAVMTLKGITALRAQQTYLFQHPISLARCQLPGYPTHVTLGRSYKTLPPKLQAFTEYIATSQVARDAGFLQQVVYEDKSLFKAAGPVWHQKDRLHLPKNLRGVDKTEANALLGADPLYTATQLATWQKQERQLLNPSLICSANSYPSRGCRNFYR